MTVCHSTTVQFCELAASLRALSQMLVRYGIAICIVFRPVQFGWHALPPGHTGGTGLLYDWCPRAVIDRRQMAPKSLNLCFSEYLFVYLLTDFADLIVFWIYIVTSFNYIVAKSASCGCCSRHIFYPLAAQTAAGAPHHLLRLLPCIDATQWNRSKQRHF